MRGTKSKHKLQKAAGKKRTALLALVSKMKDMEVDHKLATSAGEDKKFLEPNNGKGMREIWKYAEALEVLSGCNWEMQESSGQEMKQSCQQKT